MRKDIKKQRMNGSEAEMNASPPEYKEIEITGRREDMSLKW